MNTNEAHIWGQSRYYGEFNLINLALNKNLQEFSQKVGFISALQTGGKLSATEAYESIESLWRKLESAKKDLIQSMTYHN